LGAGCARADQKSKNGPRRDNATRERESFAMLIVIESEKNGPCVEADGEFSRPRVVLASGCALAK
jgi:hypothetical protein